MTGAHVVDPTTPEMVRTMIGHEARAAEICRIEALRTNEPKLREVLMMLSRKHLDHIRDLQTCFGEEDAGAAITRQINEMFL